MNEIFVPFTPEDARGMRAFQDTRAEVTGQSVVFKKEAPVKRPENATDNFWPQSLADYLRDFAEKTVQIDYLLPGGRFFRRQGVIKAVGTDFIGIQPPQGRSLLLVELNSVKSVSILNYSTDGEKQCR